MFCILLAHVGDSTVHREVQEHPTPPPPGPPKKGQKKEKREKKKKKRKARLAGFFVSLKLECLTEVVSPFSELDVICHYLRIKQPTNICASC